MKAFRKLTLLLALAIASICQANTEKAIFLAPPAANIPVQQPTLEALSLDVLHPTKTSLRSYLNASFPNANSPSGSAAWLLLYDLTPSQRYELRVCWAATQPTEFFLDVYSLDVVWETPGLLSSLAQYAKSRHDHSAPKHAEARSLPHHRERDDGQSKRDSEVSVMFLRVLAAADYHSHAAHVMAQVEPVLVDIILDPYFLNVVPQSLAPTIFYMTAVAGLAWTIAKHIRNNLLDLSSLPAQIVKKDM